MLSTPFFMSFRFDYSISGGNLESVKRTLNPSYLIITLNSESNGELTITIPRELIDSKYGQLDADFTVFIDGIPKIIDQTTTNQDRTLKIKFDSNSQEIKVEPLT